MKKGFTLVEALIAISILIIGILSGFILVTRALYNVSVIQDRLSAVFLAQEGIELVRNIRDTNFIKILNNKGTISWREGLSDGCYLIDTSMPLTLKPIACNNENDYLTYNQDLNLYLYNNGSNTSFYRQIKIETISDDEIRVISFIKWKTRNMIFDLTVEDHLYNWFKV
ncbi:MAG: prepilin-type N-terminal cleavage/methylation domain-containing protein [Minisyncoccia bacterium]